MIAEQVSLERWSSRKWRLYALSIFAIQFIVLFFISDHRPPSVRYAPKRTSFYFLGESARNGLMAENMALYDQTLFALPNLHGFSGSAWLRPVQFEYHLTNWTEEPRWLQLSDITLAATKRLTRKSNERIFFPEEPVVPLTKPHLLSATNEPKSDFWIVGSLKARPLLTPITVPLQYYSEVLSNSVVQVGVDDDGQPISTRLVKGSGWKQADYDALRLTKGFRFQPVLGHDPLSGQPRYDLDWGVIVFQWFTLSPSMTNRPPAKP